MFAAWILPSRVVDPRRKLPDLNCEVHDLLLEVVDLKVPDLRSGGIPLDLTPAACSAYNAGGANNARIAR